MTINPVSAPQRTSAPQPSRDVARAPAHRDASQLADEFAAAARKGTLPLGKQASLKDAAALPGKGQVLGRDGKPLPIGADGKPLPPPNTALARARGDGRQHPEAQSEVRKDDSALATMLGTTTGAGFAAPMQAPPPASAHVDPGAFAEMLTHIWTREQGRTAREVRVSFGDAAWPATGARLMRLEDGSLQVTVSVGYRGADVGNLDDLRDRMGLRGLNVADIAIDDGSA